MIIAALGLPFLHSSFVPLSKHNIVGSLSESDRDNVTRTETDQEAELGVHI